MFEDLDRDIREDVTARFLRYVQIGTSSCPGEYPDAHGPSSSGQWELLRLLEQELTKVGARDVRLSAEGYLYARIPASANVQSEPVCFLAHVDTSPDQPGDGVKPRCIPHFDGGTITFPDNPEITLSLDDSPQLARFVGDTIITASGSTLLGADDKAGVAEIMTAAVTLLKYPELPHAEVKICFTRDEEIGRGVSGIDLSYLPRLCYTVDGSDPGAVETECFDAWHVTISFKGADIHPGYAYGKMGNASAAAAHFAAALPRNESPEHAREREGFYHLSSIHGDVESAEMELLLRDFELSVNEGRLKTLQSILEETQSLFSNVSIEIRTEHSYLNMRRALSESPDSIDLAKQAIIDSGLDPVEHAIRGGTDGSRLTELRHPTPNLFAGGFLFHSKKEWIAQSGMALATRTLLNICELLADK